MFSGLCDILSMFSLFNFKRLKKNAIPKTRSIKLRFPSVKPTKKKDGDVVCLRQYSQRNRDSLRMIEVSPPASYHADEVLTDDRTRKSQDL